MTKIKKPKLIYKFDVISKGIGDYSYFILLAILLVIALYSAWLFYFADCEVVKQYWYMTYTPGRCL